jgi:hypothetical protein
VTVVTGDSVTVVTGDAFGFPVQFVQQLSCKVSPLQCTVCPPQDLIAAAAPPHRLHPLCASNAWAAMLPFCFSVLEGCCYVFAQYVFSEVM